MAWRLAKSLVQLRNEVHTIHPGTTFWTIGDEDHVVSDHRPNAADVVCAADVLGDKGLDLGDFAEHLVRRPHRALKYVIHNRRIWSKARAGEGWRPYSGKNPHLTHVHVSVGVGPDGQSTGPYDDTSPWGIAQAVDVTPGFPDPTLREGENGPEVEQLQRALNRALSLTLIEDGDYGPATTTAVRGLQTRAGLTADGIYGSDSATALRDLLEDNMSWNEQIDLVTGQGVSYSGTEWPAGFLLASTNYYTLKRSQEILDALKAAKLRDEAILNAIKGVDTKAILARIEQRATEDAARDAAVLAEVRDLASGGATAEEIVDRLAARLAGE